MKSLRIILLFLFLFLLTHISIVSASGIEDEDMSINPIEDGTEELKDDTMTNSSMTQSEREQLLKEIEEKEKKLKELEETERKA